MVFEEIIRSRPRRRAFALDSRGVYPDGTRRIPDLMLNLHHFGHRVAGAMPGVLNLIRAGGASTEIHFGHRVAGAMPGVLNLIRASRVLILNLYQPAVSACGRGRPRTQDARGSIILHIALNAQSPLVRRKRLQGGRAPHDMSDIQPCRYRTQHSSRYAAAVLRAMPEGCSPAPP
jgi:hypothetical protein